MQWSKLKSRVKALICPELRDRIDFHVTSYRESHDGADKVWITIDGQRAFTCSHYPYERAHVEAYYCGLEGEQIERALQDVEIHGPADFGRAMRAYLDMPIREASLSSDPLVQAFALVDRRLGKRSFDRLETCTSDHTLVKAFYELRRASTQGDV